MKNQGIILILLILLSSCQKEMHPDEPKIGDQWTYRYNSFNESGNVTSTYDANFTAYKYTVSSNTYTEHWAEVYYEGTNGYTGFPCGYYRMKDDGLYQLNNMYVGGMPSPYIPYPGIVGQSFTHYANGNFTAGMTIMSTTDSISVPYGHFSNLYRYEYLHPTFPADNLWFNDSVWFVKYEAVDSLTIGTGTYVSQSIELVNYTAH